MPARCATLDFLIDPRWQHRRQQFLNGNEGGRDPTECFWIDKKI